LLIRDVNHAQISAGFRLANRDARPFAADSILNRLPENFLDFVFLNIMAVNVRLARARIVVVAKPHTSILRHGCRPAEIAAARET
jgi:hypothetical protein